MDICVCMKNWYIVVKGLCFLDVVFKDKVMEKDRVFNVI